MKWLKIKMPLSCQNCPVIDGRLTVECPSNGLKLVVCMSSSFDMGSVEAETVIVFSQSILSKERVINNQL